MYLLVILIAIVGWLVQWNLKRKFERYSRTPIRQSGAEVAQQMLNSFGLHDVRITHVDGQLTDHYNPTNKTLNLSDAVFSERNIAAAAVAAHECGHAVQHATAYSWLTLRSKMVPAVSFSSRVAQIVILIGIFTIEAFPALMWFGIALFAVTTLFSIVTLPVEIDASQRALAWLDRSGITSYESHKEAKGALKAAAYTYVVAALSSIATLAYYVMMMLGRSRD